MFASEEIAAQFAGIAQHATDMRITFLLGLLQSFSALVLAVTLYAITRDQDPELAMLALTCRVAEGIGSMAKPRTLWLIIKGVAAPAPRQSA